MSKLNVPWRVRRGAYKALVGIPINEYPPSFNRGAWAPLGDFPDPSKLLIFICDSLFGSEEPLVAYHLVCLHIFILGNGLEPDI